MTTAQITRILARAELLEQQAAALRLAATVLADDAHTRKTNGIHRTVRAAAQLRQAQHGHTNGNGHRPAPRKVGRPASTHATTKATKAARLERTRKIIALVRDYGKPMPLKALSTAARAEGLGSLTGMWGYVLAGYLKARGRRGNTRYTFLRMPDDVVATGQ